MISLTAKQVLEAQADRHTQAALHRLLHRLKKFIRAYPLMSENEMPQHELEWVTTVECGPDRVIIDAVLSSPELWREALPSEVCMVARADLIRLGLTADVVDHLSDIGACIVASQAARRREIESCDNR